MRWRRNLIENTTCYIWCFSISLCTVIRLIGTVLEQDQSIVKDPRLNRYKVGDKGRDLALDNRRVALDHVLIFRLRYIKLGHDWNQGRDQGSLAIQSNRHSKLQISVNVLVNHMFGSSEWRCPPHRSRIRSSRNPPQTKGWSTWAPPHCPGSRTRSLSRPHRID